MNASTPTASPGVGVLDAAAAVGHGTTRPLTYDTRLDDDDREMLLALVDGDSLGEYLDRMCSDDLLTPVE